MRRGSVRVGCGVAQFRVQYGSVQGAAWLSSGCGVAQLGCGVAQYVQGTAWLSTGYGVAQLKGAVWCGSVEGCSSRVSI